MSDLGSNIGPSSTKRRIATLIALVGVIFVGSLLARVWPRDLQVAYSLDPGVTELQVDYLQEGQAVASARFKQPDAKTTVARHTVRLQPGKYEVRITVYGPDGRGVEHAKVLVVPAKGLTRFDLKEATARSE
jgi:hypothetical protein